MRTLVLAAALLTGCLAETPPTRSVRHPMYDAAVPVCTGEKPTGSNIDRTVCREQSPDDQAASAMWRDKLPENILRSPSYATDTPGLRIYR